MLFDVHDHISSIRDIKSSIWQGVARPPRNPENHSMYAHFGGGKDLAILMLLIWSAMAFASLQRFSNHHLQEVMRLLLAVVLLAFNRPLSEAITGLTGIGNVVWRWHWTMPMGLILALAAAGAVQLAVSSVPAVISSRIRSPSPLFVTQLIHITAIAFPLMILLGLFVINASHLTKKYSLDVHTIKVHQDQLAILSHLRGRDLSGRLVLADQRVAQLLPRIVHEAHVISAGPIYWSHPYFSSKEILARYRLEKIINAGNLPSEQDIAFLHQEIRSRGINLLVFDGRVEAMEPISKLAKEEHMTCSTVGVWQLCQQD